MSLVQLAIAMSDVHGYVGRSPAAAWQLNWRTYNFASSSSDKSLQRPSSSNTTRWWQASNADKSFAILASSNSLSSPVFSSNSNDCSDTQSALATGADPKHSHRHPFWCYRSRRTKTNHVNHVTKHRWYITITVRMLPSWVSMATSKSCSYQTS